MARSTRRKFTVEGSGEFPYDMLRYDQCWPRSEEHDSYKLASPYVKNESDRRRSVTLLTDSPAAPNYQRWESFGWRVTASELQQ